MNVLVASIDINKVELDKSDREQAVKKKALYNGVLYFVVMDEDLYDYSPGMKQCKLFESDLIVSLKVVSNPPPCIANFLEGHNRLHLYFGDTFEDAVEESGCNLDSFMVSDSFVQNYTEIKESNTMSSISKMGQKNFSAAKTAAKIATGKVVLSRIVKVIKPQLPMMARGYCETPWAQLAIANAIYLGVSQYAPDNERAMLLAELAVDAATSLVVDSFDIDSKLDELFKGIKLPKNIVEEE